MTIAIIAAEHFELDPFRARLEGIAREEGLPVRYAHRGRWRGNDVWLCANGPGFALATEAARTVIPAANPDRVWSVGLCGGLDRKLAAGDVVTGKTVVDAASGEHFSALPFLDQEGVTVVCQDRVAVDAGEKGVLAQLGDVVDMESAAVAREAGKHGIPFQCVKAVSDTAGESFAIDFNAARGADGRFPVGRVIASALRSPRKGIAELAHLYGRGKMGAERLGDWIGNCRV